MRRSTIISICFKTLFKCATPACYECSKVLPKTLPSLQKRIEQRRRILGRKLGVYPKQYESIKKYNKRVVYQFQCVERTLSPEIILTPYEKQKIDKNIKDAWN